MSAFPEYDPEVDAIHLNGGAIVMLTLLMKAKFGEKFDPEVLFHERVAELIRQLEKAAGNQPQAATCFGRDDLDRIARGVFNNSCQNGWWEKGAEQRVQFLQDAASPWILAPDQIEDIIDTIDSQLSRIAQIADMAERAKRD